MKSAERIREALAGIPTAEYFRQRSFEGWKPVAMIWERPIDGAPEEDWREDPPFGMRVSGDCSTLVEDAPEKKVILAIFEGVVQDRRISQIARDLNEQGHRTRRGERWTPKDVFELLPRLVELGPRVFPSAEWAERRRALLQTGAV